MRANAQYLQKKRGTTAMISQLRNHFVKRAVSTSAGHRRAKIARSPRTPPRHDKYYFPKIATSPLRDIIPETLRMCARVLQFIHGTLQQEAPAHLETGASLCGQIHRIYRCLYVHARERERERELALHNRFSAECIVGEDGASERSLAPRSISHSFIVPSLCTLERIVASVQLVRDYCLRVRACASRLCHQRDAQGFYSHRYVECGRDYSFRLARIRELASDASASDNLAITISTRKLHYERPPFGGWGGSDGRASAL